uniref:RRP15-like protein n=1 Tax=Capra hircus TaxID=9925 RepID=A0A8C2R5X6_CAPHI
MAAAVGDSRVSAGKKLKNSLRKKKRMKMVVPSVASELEDKVKDASDNEGSCALEKDHFSSGDEAGEADSEGDAEPREDDNASAAEASVGTNAGWADAMARVLNKKIPESKPTILVRNKELEKEKEKLKQERLEKRKQLDKKREWEMMCRVKPDVVKDKETERNLQRIATRFKLKLRKRKKRRKKKEKRKKKNSTELRQRYITIKNVTEKKTTEAKSEEGPGWTILRDDFMMGASMKDWDKESDGPDARGPGSGSDSDT